MVSIDIVLCIQANMCRVLESLKAGIRLPEARFSNVKVAAKGQGSVYALCGGAS